MLWAVGAWIGFALLRDWPQAGLAALLTPAWLAGEWFETRRLFIGREKPLAHGLLLLSITYLTATVPGKDSAVRKTLVWIGALTLPLFAAWVGVDAGYSWQRTAMPSLYLAVGWFSAIALPLLIASCLRRQALRWNLVAALWVIALGSTGYRAAPVESALAYFWRDLGHI